MFSPPWGDNNPLKPSGWKRLECEGLWLWASPPPAPSYMEFEGLKNFLPKCLECSRNSMPSDGGQGEGSALATGFCFRFCGVCSEAWRHPGSLTAVRVSFSVFLASWWNRHHLSPATGGPWDVSGGGDHSHMTHGTQGGKETCPRRHPALLLPPGFSA